jgi:peptidoglycan/xylan/chitin deacetylase (PgdA/CDA1 family)
MNRRLLVLAWHNIEPTWGFPGATAAAGRQGFAHQLRLLRRWTNVLPLDTALADLTAGRPLPPRAVALTFDDGYLDNATVAAPMLRHAGLPATFFLVPEFLGGKSGPWWEELGWALAHATAPELHWQGVRYDTSTTSGRHRALDAIAPQLKVDNSAIRKAAVDELTGLLAPEGPLVSSDFMDWDDAHALLRAGFDIGSHTCSHPILSRERAETQRRELIDSRQGLQTELGCPVDTVAFPNGRAEDYSQTTLELVREAGYAYALTTRTALVDPDVPPHEIGRLVITPETNVRTLMLEAARTLKRRAVARRISGD